MVSSLIDTTPDNTTEGKIALKKDGAFEDSALTETATEIESSKTIRADIVAPTGSYAFEDTSQLSTNSDTLEIQDCVRVERHEILTEIYDDTGSQRPQQSVKSGIQTFDVHLLDDEQSGSFEVIFPTLTNVHWQKIIIKAREAGTGIFTIRDTDENGCILNTKTEFNINGILPFGVDIPVEIPLENRIKLFTGQQIWVKYEGPALAGHQYSGDPIWGDQFVPFARTISQPFTNKGLALLEDIPDHGDYLDKATYDPGSVEGDVFARANHTGTQTASTISDFDTEVENNPQVSANTTKLLGIEEGAEENQTDAEIKAQYEANANTNAYTDSEKSKLAGLESSKFLGEFISLSALETAHPSPVIGSYANVDAGAGSDVERYVWDDNDSKYVLQLGESTQLTASEVKVLYESNPDTNAFTDSDESKLDGVEAGAEVNQSDLEIKNQYENNANTNAYTDTEKSKLGGIESGAEVNQSNTEIKSQYEANANTNAFTDAEKTNLSNQSGTNSGDVTLKATAPTQESASLTGQELELKQATPTTDGIMSSEDKTKIDNVVANGAGDGWISGLDVTEDSPKGTTVLYGAGTYLINGIDKAIALNGTYDLANGFGAVDHYSGMTNDQHALVSICVDADQAIKSLRGDVGEKGDTIFPPLQSPDSVCVAYVEIKVNSSGVPKEIDNKHIFDQRTTQSINTDETVSVSVDDLTTGYLIDKISNTGNVQATIINPGANEQIKLDTTGGGATVPPSIEYTGTANIDGLDVSTISPRGVLWVNSTGDIELRSLQNGVDKQIIIVINMTLKKLRFKFDAGTHQKLYTEGAADIIADKYGGQSIIYNATSGHWHYVGVA